MTELRIIGEVFDADNPDAPGWLRDRGDGSWEAPMGALVPGGLLTCTIRWAPDYDNEGLSGTRHTLLYLNEENQIYYPAGDEWVVLVVDGIEYHSAQLTFAASQELELRVLHSADRMRLVISGATTGNGNTDAPGRAPYVDLPSVGYVLGGPDGAEDSASLVYLAPCQSFAELVETRHLVQMSVDPSDFRDLMAILAEEPARTFDVALAVRDGFDLDYAYGAQLDTIGSIVGLPREGFLDDRYRDFLRIQVELLLAEAREDAEWTGTCESIIRIARTFVGLTPGESVVYRNAPPYAFVVTVPGLVAKAAEDGVTLAVEVRYLRRFLKTAAYGGVLGHLFVSLAENSRWGSVNVTVARRGKWGSVNASITDPARWGTVVTTE